MTAKIIFGVDFRNKTREPEKSLDQMAMEVMNQCFPATWIDSPQPDTAPAEYIAPMADPA